MNSESHKKFKLETEKKLNYSQNKSDQPQTYQFKREISGKQKTSRAIKRGKIHNKILKIARD